MKLATKFFLAATVFALCGMVWGIVMSASHDYLLAPAHGHLNLLGFVAMGIWGAYYALTPTAAASNLGRSHFALSVLSVVVVVPGIVQVLLGQGELLAQIGSIALVANMLLFGVIVLRFGAGAQAPNDLLTAQPAE
ncbi:hypothetical protein [Sulfitobacter delicatus]|uniref:Uncharacterized protein n=1 Tax=Sulfitobacter delicatus TaxID=218672 RepID=A0A1G7TQ46_9RHOB|nr:hypothetical protein [Sulfitobacter delicatus]SDG37341.1 hypothetical protein SAMN04489759_10722 [Sulfitobacter delicatus]